VGEPEFDWDEDKAAENLAKHGVSFEEAATVLRDDRLAVTVPDTLHSDDEDRWLTIGLSSDQRLLVVWHTYRGNVIRLIGARLPRPRERRAYESSQQ
jgi:uncharacterized DUF497 family protein